MNVWSAAHWCRVLASACLLLLLMLAVAVPHTLAAPTATASSKQAGKPEQSEAELQNKMERDLQKSLQDFDLLQKELKR